RFFFSFVVLSERLFEVTFIKRNKKLMFVFYFIGLSAALRGYLVSFLFLLSNETVTNFSFFLSFVDFVVGFFWVGLISKVKQLRNIRFFLFFFFKKKEW